MLVVSLVSGSRFGLPTTVREKIAEINSIIARLHDNEKVFYLDIGDIFLDARGNIPRDIMSDGLHPTTKGYELSAKAVQGTSKGIAVIRIHEAKQ